MAAENNRSFYIQLWLTVQMQIGYLFTMPHSPVLFWPPSFVISFKRKKLEDQIRCGFSARSNKHCVVVTGKENTL